MIRIRQMIAPPIMIRRLKICFLFRLCARIQAGECCLYSSLWSLWVLGSLRSLGPLDPLWSLSLFMSVFSLFYFIRIYQDATTGSAPKWCRTLICIGYDHVIPFQLRYFYKISSVCIRQLFIISVPECLVKNAGSFLSQRSIFSTSLSVPVLSCCRFFVIRPRFSGSAKESKMLQQNLDPHEDQDQSADKLCLRLVLHSEYITDLHADRRQDKCRTSDEGHCPDDVYM